MKEPETFTKDEWVTLPNKRSPRNTSQERDSKSHRKGSPQKSPHASSLPENRYSPLIDHAHPVDQMDYQTTEPSSQDIQVATGPFPGGLLEEEGYDTDPTSNMSSRPKLPPSRNQALENIREQSIQNSYRCWDDEEDEDDECSVAPTTDKSLSESSQITNTEHTSDLQTPISTPSRSQYNNSPSGRGGPPK
jgi:hypothetical protein